MDGKAERLLTVVACVAVGFVLYTTALGQADQGKGPRQREFTERDALHCLQELGDALESHDEGKFLKAFDGGQMPGYPVFRDQVDAAFSQYESFLVSYQLQQVAMQGSYGVLLADFTVDARPAGGTLPDVRKQAQLRLVLEWNNKAWKIVDLSPRTFFGAP